MFEVPSGTKDPRREPRRAWHAAKAVVPGMIDRGTGSIVFISSTVGLKGAPHQAHYVASKHGIQGLLPIPWVQPEDVSNAVAWLASDEARYVTGVAIPVDGGLLAKF